MYPCSARRCSCTSARHRPGRRTRPPHSHPCIAEPDGLFGEGAVEETGVTGSAPTVRVAKHRRTGVLDGAELCVDDLDGVGTFLELERIVDKETDEASVQAELAAVVSGLDVACERTTETYAGLVGRS
ncbi:CYTH domain-containing protein [Streptomyces sp. NPDC101062]|uniref:CYTH domain-containing protein n=1 Tax=unclassified Streptomyces TaxID=2593676 RepID=UPI00380D4CB3